MRRRRLCAWLGALSLVLLALVCSSGGALLTVSSATGTPMVVDGVSVAPFNASDDVTDDYAVSFMVTDATLLWSVDAAARFSWSMSLADTATAQVTTTVGEATGVAPQTPTSRALHFACLAAADVVLRHDVTVTDSATGTTATVTFFMHKRCPFADLCALCAADCPASATCTCANAACTVAPRSEPAVVESVENLSVRFWRMGTDVAVAASKLIAAAPDIAILSNVPTDYTRAALYSATQPYAMRQARDAASGADAGMLLESRFKLGWEVYTSLEDGTAGVLAAVAEITPYQSLLVMAAHFDSSANATAQAAQLVAVNKTINSNILGAKARYCLGKLNIVVFGGPDTGTLLSYDDIMNGIMHPRDLLAGTSADHTVGTFAGALNVTRSGGDSHTVAVKDVSVTKVDAAVSAQPIVVVTLDFSHSYLVDILVPVIVCGVLLIIIGALLSTTYCCHKSIPAPNWLRVYARQGSAVMKKNWLALVRNRRALVIQLVVPIMFVVLLYCMQVSHDSIFSNSPYVPERNTSHALNVTGIPRCAGASCVTLMYSPNTDTLAASFIYKVADAAGIPHSEVMAMVDTAAADAYILANPQKVVAAVHCETELGTGFNNGLTELLAFRYVVQYNRTVVTPPHQATPNPPTELVLPLQKAIDAVVLAYQHQYATGEDTFSLAINALAFPHDELPFTSVIGVSGPNFFLGCLMFNFVIQMGQIVGERELHLREAMSVVGLRDAVYWGTWVCTNLFWNTVSVFILVAAGAAFQMPFFIQNDFGTYFFLFFLFGLAMVTFALFVSLFLSRARTATTVGFALYMIGVIGMGTVYFLFDPTGSRDLVNVLCLIPFMALAKGMFDLGNWTSGPGSKGLRWHDRFYSDTFVPLSEIYNWLIIDFFFYLALVLTYDFLFGGTRGESRVRSWINRLTSRKPVDDESTLSGEEPEVAEERRQVKTGGYKDHEGIDLRGLQKTYFQYSYGVVRDKSRDFHAVAGNWLHIEDKQLFCLLGHNGAGKSTTISMLTGLLAPTGGDATVFGKSLTQHPDAIRAEMGVCPQFDILWSELTGAEHLTLFCALKGVPRHRWDAEAAAQLAAVGLTGEAHMHAKTYSGGQKRRLSVAIALAGNPRVVYLDEPTTGMDPISRRQVWELLERERRQRTIILTTHSMEEADMLSDRIAIMKDGRIKCIGTALHLKNHYGSGYRMAVVTKTPGHVPSVQGIVAKELPTAQLDHVAGMSILYEVPFSAADALPRFLRMVEERGAELGVVDIQVGMTSLEDVFLRVASHEPPADEIVADEDLSLDVRSGSVDSKDSRSKSTTSTEDESAPLSGDSKQAWSDGTAAASGGSKSGGGGGSKSAGGGNGGGKRPAGNKVGSAPTTTASSSSGSGGNSSSGSEFKVKERHVSWFQQLKALSAKSWTVQLRNYKTNLCQMTFPLALILVLFGFQYLIDGSTQRLQGDLTAPSLHPPVLPAAFVLPASFDLGRDCPATVEPPVINRLVGQVLVGARGAAASAVGTYGLAGLDAVGSMWQTSQYTGLLGMVSKNPADMIGFMSESFPDDDTAVLSTPICYSRPFVLPITFAAVDPTTIDATLRQGYCRPVSIPAAYAFDDVDVAGGKLHYDVYFNETANLGTDLPLLINLINNAAFKSMQTGNETDGLVFLGTKDFPSPAQPTNFDFVTGTGPFVYLIVLHLYLPVMLGFMVYEKEYKLREIMKMMGLKNEIYWLVRYVTFFTMYLIAIMVMVGAGVLLEVRYFTINAFISYFSVILVWGMSLIAQGFLAGAFFGNSRTGNIAGYLYAFGSALICMFIVQPFYANPATSVNTMRATMVIPSLALYRGLDALRIGVVNQGTGIKVADMVVNTGLVDSLIAMSIQWVIFMVLAAYADKVVPDGMTVKLPIFFWLQPSYWCGTKKISHVEKPIGALTINEYPEAVAERDRAWDSTGSVIRAMGLRKVYPSLAGGSPAVTAVSSVSFAVDHKECYGMLGPNGAGKSTTMNMLSGLVAPSAGTAVIGGRDLIHDINAVHMLLGVCPQDNLLWEELTSYEHMAFYGRLKGITDRAELAKEIEHRLTQVELWKVRHKRAGRYSGGMKRRLAVAISLIGTPPVVLLDEPTTGLDPKTRNHLWDVIREAKAHSAVLMTTHSMEEAEALCERVGIFVAGEMRTTGTPAHLKYSFGECVKLTLTGPPADVFALHDKLVDLVPGAEIINEPIEGTRVYALPQEEIRMSVLFSNMARWAVEYHIIDWGISNVSLEEVFIRVAETQRLVSTQSRSQSRSRSRSLSHSASLSSFETNSDAESHEFEY